MHRTILEENAIHPAIRAQVAALHRELIDEVQTTVRAHAVVVIGFTKTAGDETADRIHYLDPASAKVLHSEDRKTFETLWARGEHAMMMVIAPPQEPGTGSAQ